MTREIYCDSCGSVIPDIMHCSLYRSAGPFYNTIYICEECSKKTSLLIRKDSKSEEMTHVDMDGGEAL